MPHEIYTSSSLSSIADETMNQPDDSSNIKLSKRRWAVLTVVVVIGITSAFVQTVDPILNTFVELLGLTLHQYIYINQLFNYVPFITLVPTAWFMNRYGFRKLTYLLVILILIRNTLKFLLFQIHLKYWAQLRLVYWSVATSVNTVILSIFFSLPLMVSEYWFSESERSIAWALMASSESIGVCIVGILLPRYITSVDDLPLLGYLSAICAVIVVFLVAVCITKSKPTSPPSERVQHAISQKAPFFKSIKNLIRSKYLLLHLLHGCLSQAVTLSVLMVIQDILQSSGHNRLFVGEVVSIMNLIQLIMMLVLSTLIHGLEDSAWNCRMASALANIVFIGYSLVILIPNPTWVILTMTFLYAITTSWTNPNFNNMIAELSCGVLAQSTISSISVFITCVFTSLFNIAFISLMYKDANGISNYTNSMILVASTLIITTLIYVTLFNPPQRKKPSDEVRIVDDSDDN